MTTIGNSTTLGIVLSSPSDTNPVVIHSGVSITGNRAGSGNGIAAYSGSWTISNFGYVAAVGSSAASVYLAAGGAVTNQIGGVIGAPSSDLGAIYILGGAGSVTNAGTINAGVWLQTGGAVTNLNGGAIVSASTSGGYGVGLHADGTVTNAGQIGGLFLGVEEDLGGTVANQSGGTITGAWLGVVIGFEDQPTSGDSHNVVNQAGGTISGDTGILAGGGAATVTNVGDIVGTFADAVSRNGITLAVGAGISLSAGGTVTNEIGGRITGASYGVYIGNAAGTVINSGTISGASGAVRFAPGQNDRLVADPGAVFNGSVNGGNAVGAAAVSTLELASGVSAGSLPGLGAAFTNFGAIVFDAGAQWSIAGDSSGLAGTISGFAVGDTIELTGVFATGSSYGGGILTLDETGGSATLDLPGSFTTTSFKVTDVAGGTEVSVACFREGTRIATGRGDVSVEGLQVGDSVLAHAGDGRTALQSVVWLGHCSVDCRRHPRPHDVWPVRIAAGAFGAGRPRRELLLSPDHAVFIGGVLIPIRYLLNGRTVVQEPHDEITYWHVELERHGVLLAEGLPCESYLDTGNRAAFANGGTAVQMQPDFAMKIWQAEACAPLVRGGAGLAAARSVLLDRACDLGHARTDDPALRIVVNGCPVTAAVDGRYWRVRLPEAVSSVRLQSRAWTPAHALPDADDTRCLGVAISHIWLDGRDVSPDSPAFSVGWHAPEPGWRWTDGASELAVAGVRELAFEVLMTGTYWQDGRHRQKRAA